MMNFLRDLKLRLLARFGRRPAFRSNEEYFEWVEFLASSLGAHGAPESAALVREGLGLLNGLTDGWALLLEHLEKARAALPPGARDEDRRLLEALAEGARRAITRS